MLFTSDDAPDAEVEPQLRRQIVAYAGQCKLPAVALVTRQASEQDVLCSDPRLVACVLTQASLRVYLRDKEPNLSQLQRDRQLILVLTSQESSQ